MKKKIYVAIGLVMMIGCMSACGATTEGAAENNANAEIETAADTNSVGDEIFSTDDYSIAYTPGSFEVNETRDSVILSYCNSEIQAAGSNVIIIAKEEGCSVDDIITAIVGDDSMDNVSEGSLGADMIPVKSYVRPSEPSEDSGLTLYDQVMVMQDGDDVITVEIIRTVGQDDAIDMPIEGAFTHTLESFVLK